MRVWQWERFGDPSGLALRETAPPEPGHAEALVRLRASSLNHRDLMVARGIAVGGALTPGLVPLSDGAGEIVALGAGANRFAVGDRVCAAFRQGWIDGPSYSSDACNDLGGGRDGTLRDYAVFDQESLVSIPAHLTYAEATTLPCAAVTAWNAVVCKGAICPGQTVLTQGSGGVSLFALQLAGVAGARVIATTSNAAKAERLRSLGADEVI